MNGYTYLAVAGQPTIGLNSTNNTLTIQPAGGISFFPPRTAGGDNTASPATASDVRGWKASKIQRHP
jgi:hypothetical protein